jgi:perosamine synthetase
LSGNEKKYVNECLDTTWISSAGKFITEFEHAFAKVAGTKHAIAVNNGTTALHLALVALGIGPGDEVIVPTLTYIASANAIKYTGATPAFVDSCADTLNLDPQAVEAAITPRTKAIMPVHLYGHPADMTAINKIAAAHNLLVIEDAAEAHGATVNGKPVGSIGDVGVFSFFGNKIVTTGEGGAVTTDDDDLAAHLRILRGQGMDPKRRYWFPIIGFNYRMTNIEAALGLAQLEQFDDFVSRRDAIGARYNELLADVPNLELPVERDDCRRVTWCYTVIVSDFDAAKRDELMALMAADGIETRPVFYPLHVMPPYYSSVSYPVAEHLGAAGLSLPTHLSLSDEDLQAVASSLAANVAKIRAAR